jgi:hypothetical protein
MTVTTALPALFDGLAGADWDQPATILPAVTPLFDALTGDPDLLTALVDTLPSNPHLTAMCEQYDFVSKLVLHHGPTDVRLRLHLYRDGFFDRPHNHRWSFASHILRGRYRHRIYGNDTGFTEQTDPATLTPIIERDELTGDRYALHHTAVHTVQADTDTISLLVRGPAAKDRFLIHDVAAGRFFWVTGAAQETPQQRTSKQMTPDQLTTTISRVKALIQANTVTGGAR